MILESAIELILSFVINVVNYILTPIDNLIIQYFQGLGNLLSYISSFFNYISNLIPWVVSYLGLSQELLDLIVMVFIFKLTVSFGVYILKLSVRWFHYLKF